MVAKIDRTGERNINNFGSEMIVIKYRNWDNTNVYFPQYNWIAKNKNYGNFKKGEIKCPYERRYFGFGYLGEGEYKVSENGEVTRCYKTWYDMLRRCYDEKFHKRQFTYRNCKTYEEWLNFQNFGYWDKENYYKIESEKMCLDKDILYKGNKIYSPNTCIYVPERINTLFVKSDKNRGELYIGIYLNKDGKYVTQCRLVNPETGKSKQEYLGVYETQEKAFEVYKYYKEKNIKQVADYYKDKIPQRLYEALYNYEVEITD